MKTRSIAIAMIALLLLPSIARGDLPPTADAWTEYASSTEASTDGWFTECGLSQQLVVDPDCTCGSMSVGRRGSLRIGLGRAAMPRE